MPKEKKIVLLEDLIVPKGTVLTYIPDGSTTVYQEGNYQCYLDWHKDSAPALIVGDEVLDLMPEQFAEVK